jgi:hypothetical protein
MPGRHADTARRQQLIARRGQRGWLLNALAAAIGFGICLGVGAYAVTLPAPGSARPTASTWRALLPPPTRIAAAGGSRYAPRIVGHPALSATASSATFRFTEPAGARGFQCRLDREEWAACHSPVVLNGLSLGRHDFLVRGEGPAGRADESALFPWTVFEPRPVSILPQLSDLSDLYPGAVPVVLPVEVVNPNSSPIAVTHLEVSVSRDSPGCPSAENLELIPSNVSSARPLRLRPGESTWLPSGGILAPAIRLRDLPANQNACERAQFPLVFSGTAHG